MNTGPASISTRALPLVFAFALALGSFLAPARPVLADDRPDATDGGLVPTARRVIIPGPEIGLSRELPIPLGATCSCTIDRVGVISQFDITILQVVPDAYPMILQLNRFNAPPSPGQRYVGVYVGQQYIAGPENQAYSVTDSDWKATSRLERLRDVQQLFHVDREYRPRADAYPGNYINGWLFFELPLNQPSYMVWNYNFVGERGIWFALQ